MLCEVWRRGGGEMVMMGGECRRRRIFTTTAKAVVISPLIVTDTSSVTASAGPSRFAWGGGGRFARVLTCRISIGSMVVIETAPDFVYSLGVFS